MGRTTNRREFMHAGFAAAGMMAAARPLGGAEPQARPAQSAAARTMGAKFRELLQSGQPFENIGAHDVLAARMTEMMGFRSLFLGSSMAAEFHGIPDWSVLSDTERIDFAAHIAQSVNIPSLVDIDEGGVTPLTLYRSVKKYERAGIGAVHLTDDISPIGRARTLPMNDMLDRIHGAVDARSDMVVTLRCTGWARDGKQQTLDRAAAYTEAGAETIWFIGAPLDELAGIAQTVKVPLTAQFFADAPMSRAKDLKVTLVVYASLLQNIAQSAVYDALMEFKNTGMWVKSAKGQRLGQTIPAEVRAKLLEQNEYGERGKKYNVGN